MSLDPHALPQPAWRAPRHDWTRAEVRALFALPHIGPGTRFLPWMVTSFFVGLAMAVLFQQFGHLGGPIAAHFLLNLMNLRYITRHEMA